MGINADLSNFHYFPTDCPHREKNGWTGDVTASAEQLLLSLNAKRSLGLWLKSMRHAQKESGMLPGIVPTTGWGYTWGNGPFWDACAICLPYYIYKYDGEKDILSENAEMMHRYLKYVASRRDSQGLIAVGLGDWVQPKRAELGLLSPLALTDSATIYNAALKAAFIFDVLGHNEWRDHARSLADELRAAIRKNLISFDTMTAAGDCQTSQSLLLYLGIFEPDEEARAYARLIDIIKRDGEHLMCGVIGLRYIFEVLIRGGDADLAYKMITRKDAPSYGAMIESGATALCESLIENGCQESQNHHFFGDIIRVFISLIAGLSINPSVQNKNELLFEPHLISKLDRACAEYDFEAGKAFGGWERTADGVKLFVTLPEGVCGTVRYGSLSAELVCGYNEFTVRE
jgi:alpha-L-rhamnosidase